MRFSPLWLLLAFSTAHAGGAPPVDHLSAHISPDLRGEITDARYRALTLLKSDVVLVTSAEMAAPAADCEQLILQIKMKEEAPRLLLVDAGVIFLAGDQAYLPIPNQRFLIKGTEAKLTIEALPLTSSTRRAAPGAPLKAVHTAQDEVLSVARAVQHVEGDEMHRHRLYVREIDGALKVDTFLKNRDVMIARSMTWRRDAQGVIQGRLSREIIRLTLFAVTSGYTIQEAADWIRRERISDMEAAIKEARAVSRRVGYLLERARLNHKVFTPEYADFYFNRGLKAFAQGELERALKAFEEAANHDASMVEARYNIGIVHYRAGKYDEAANAFLIASGHPRAFPEVFFNRAAVALRKKDKRGGLRALKAYLKRVSKDPEAEAWIERLEPKPKEGEG